jgi:hypothetical protein
MFHDIGITIEFCAKYHITVKQFLLCYVLYLDKQESQGRPLSKRGPAIANIYKYTSKVEPWGFDDIDNLVERGLLRDLNKAMKDGRGTHPDMLEVTEKFVAAIMATMTQFDAFWAAYPAFTKNFNHPGGRMITLKAADKVDLEKTYLRKVKTKAQHAFVMEMLTWAKQNDMVNMSIAKYVGSEMWDQHHELVETGGGDRVIHHTVNQ